MPLPIIPPSRIAYIILTLQFFSFPVAVAQRYFAPFGLVTELRAGSNARGILSGDFNGDHRQDVLSYGAHRLFLHTIDSTLLGFQQSQFAIEENIDTMIVLRSNNDRLADIVFLTSDNPRSMVSYIGKSRGNFYKVWQHTLSVQQPRMVSGDINSDGKTDIIIYSEKYLGFQVFIGQGAGSFSGPSTMLGEYSFSAIAVRDITDDQLNDLVATSWISNELLVFTAFGKMRFADPSIIPLSDEPAFVRVAQIDEHPAADLILGFRNSGRVETFSGDGLGQFTRLQNFSLGERIHQISVADMDNDKVDDIITFLPRGGAIAVSRNSGPTKFLEPISYSAGIAPAQMQVIRHDLFPDVAVLDAGVGMIRVFHSSLRTDKTVRFPSQYATGLVPGPILVTDIVGDESKDILVGDVGSRSFSLYPNRRKGLPVGKIHLDIPSNPSDIRYVPKSDTTAVLLAMDADGDTLGIADFDSFSLLTSKPQVLSLEKGSKILTTKVDSQKNVFLYVLEPRGNSTGLIEFQQVPSGRFIERTILPALGYGSVSTSLVAYPSLNKTPALLYSFIEPSSQQRKILLVENVLQQPRQPVEVSIPISMTAGSSVRVWSEDIDGDSYQDLILNLSAPEKMLMVCLGRDDTTFAGPVFTVQNIAIESNAGNLLVADINADGKKDIITNNEATKSLQVFMGRGQGYFSDSIRLMSTEGIGGFAFADINGDSIPELLVTDSVRGLLRVLSVEGNGR